MYKSTLARSPLANFSVFLFSLSLPLFAFLPSFYTWTTSSGRSVKTTWKCILITCVLVATPTNVEMSLFNLMCLNQQKYAIKWESGQRRCRLKSVPESPLKWARPSRTDRQTDRPGRLRETDSWTVCHFWAHSFKCRNKLTTLRAKAEEPQKQYHKQRRPQTTCRSYPLPAEHFPIWPSGMRASLRLSN